MYRQLVDASLLMGAITIAKVDPGLLPVVVVTLLTVPNPISDRVKKSWKIFCQYKK